MEYHYLVAGLADLSFDDGKTPQTVVSCIEMLRESFSPKDMRWLDLFVAQYDNRNLLNVLKGGQDELDTRGNLPVSIFEELRKEMDERSLKELGMADYMIAFLADYYAESPDKKARPDEALAAIYYQSGMQAENAFVAQWYEMNLNVNNVLSALTARKYGLEVSSVVVGDNEVARNIRNSVSRDFGLSSSLDYAETIIRIAEETNLVERERKIDLFKWQWLEEQTFFNYFTVERPLKYLYQLEMLERWASLDKKLGEDRFRMMIKAFKQKAKTSEN